jgi:hypothetical protein
MTRQDLRSETPLARLVRVRPIAVVLVLALVTPALVVACGSGATSATSETTARPAFEPIRGPPRPWAELSRDERLRHMVREVLPRMSALFREYDAARYADFDCANCHGADAAARDYAMPSPDLLPLWPTGTEGQREMVRRYPEGVRFMFQRVLPTMRTLLGQPEYDEATRSGFSCFACHPHAEDSAPATEGDR